MQDKKTFDWIYCSYPDLAGNGFAIKQTHGKNGKSPALNFWRIKDGHCYFFTFYITKKYNTRTNWTEQLCQAVLADLVSPNPTLKVVRLAVDGHLIYGKGKYNNKSLPTPPNASPGNYHIAQVQKIHDKE